MVGRSRLKASKRPVTAPSGVWVLFDSRDAHSEEPGNRQAVLYKLVGLDHRRRVFREATAYVARDPFLE
jgi:hypothetical protein